MKAYSYYIIYKPYGMLSQFTGEEGVPVLGDLYDFPKDVYPVGRLDKDSEGLLVLTNDNVLKNKLLDPTSKTPKTYYAQVDGDIDAKAIELLCSGTIIIKHKGKPYQVAPATAKKIPAPNFPERSKPVRYRRNVPTSWVSLTLTEGKNRQVRKMTAAAGFPTLRLVRFAIGKYKLDNMQPSDVVELEEKDTLSLMSS